MTAPNTTPAAPAAAPASVVPAPQHTGPQRSAVELASDAARASIASTGSAIAPAHPSANQPRREDGQFSADARREVGGGVAPEAGRQSPAPEPGVEETRSLPAGDPAAAGQPAPAIEATTGSEGEEGEEELAPETPEEVADRLRVTIPGRREGEEVDLTFGDQESADRVRALMKNAARVSEVEAIREQASQQFAELESFRDQIASDPAGFIIDSMATEPALMQHLALYLLTQPNVWNGIGRTVLQLDDPNNLRLIQAEVQRDRYDMRDSFKTAAEERRVVDRNLREVTGTVGSIVGENAALYKACMEDLRDHANRMGLLTLPVEDIPVILARRLRSAGMNPLEVVARMQESQGPRQGARPAAPTRKPASTTPPPAPQSGKNFVQGSVRRRVAAAVAGPGAGAPNSGAISGPPAGSTSQQAIDWHRQQVAKGANR